MKKGLPNWQGIYTPNDLVAYEYAVKGNAPSQVSKKYKKKEEEKALSGFSAGYDPTANVIRLSWQSSMEGPFNLTMSINGGAEQALPAASEKGYTLANPEPGATYSFRVTSSNGSSLTASVQVPTLDPIEEIIDENIDNENMKTKTKMKITMVTITATMGKEMETIMVITATMGKEMETIMVITATMEMATMVTITEPHLIQILLKRKLRSSKAVKLSKSKNKYSNNQRNLGKRYQHSRYHQKHKNRIEKKRLRALSFRRFLCDFIHHSFYRFALFMTACFLNNFSISTKASDS